MVKKKECGKTQMPKISIQIRTDTHLIVQESMLLRPLTKHTWYPRNIDINIQNPSRDIVQILIKVNLQAILFLTIKVM